MSCKKIIAAVMTMAILTVAAGCGGKAPASDTKKVLDPIKTADAMLAVLAPQGEMLAVEDSVLDNYYTVDKDIVGGQKIYISTSFIAEEIAVFAVKDGKTEDAKKMCEARLKDLKDSFDGYLPEELASLEANAKILTNGNLVCLLAGKGDGLAAAEKVFTES
ncbi:MAG: DUF4358 domain-containing protein [Angelakisella sp.]